MNLHEVYLAAQIAAKEVIKGGGSSSPIDTQVNGESENAVQNKAIYDFVNSSVANSTAYFKGTYNSVAELETIVDVTNNDYAFVVNVDIYGNTVYNRYKYSDNEWLFEYALNNSSFTANQWATINSGVTSADIQNLQDGKVDKVTGMGLSKNNFSDADKSKLDDLENYDDTEIKSDIAKTAEQSALNRGTLGYQRKNFLNNTLTSKTVNGITFTLNEDKSITVNGTATVAVQVDVFTIPSDLVGKTMVLSGCPFGGNYQAGYALYAARTVSNTNTFGYDVGGGVKVTIPENGCKVRIIVRAGATVNNQIFYPMLRCAEITDNTYEPYKPSVEERLNDITDRIWGLGTNIPSGANLNDYTQPGVYYVSSSTVAATLLNSPLSGTGFRLEICCTAMTNRFIQKIYANSMVPAIFMRSYGTNGFGSWYKVPVEAIETT